MGRYHAPESLDSALASSLDPKIKKQHPLGARAKNLSQDVLVVRFEMPFAIWCSTCASSSTAAIIGQGVRFNAQKKQAGKYYSSPIWSFRMKHTACGGWIELRTDPKNSDFIVTEGAKRRDYGAPEVGPSTVMTEAQKKRQDAFTALEGKRDEKIQLKEEAVRIEELRSLRERDWKHSDERNQKIRKDFRVGRRAREQDQRKKDDLQETMGLGMELEDSNDVDLQRARLIDFGGLPDDVGDTATRSQSLSYPRQKAEGGSVGDQTRLRALRQNLLTNTRNNHDPFSAAPFTNDSSRQTGRSPGFKRKRADKLKTEGASLQPHVQKGQDPHALRHDQEATNNVVTDTNITNPPPMKSDTLVDYDSD
ncbi:MAG: hypothetical protein M1828_007209 [Chrysothrix sp. TS-e1954]|nr:MAG: hypothetical protein M1828_007209 [Chrysothrix sp. TS-e1954]